LSKGVLSGIDDLRVRIIVVEVGFITDGDKSIVSFY